MDADAELTAVVRSTMEAAKLMQLIAERAPEQSTGNDPIGVASATVDRNGRLVDISIMEDWPTRITLGSLSAHVMSALSKAQTARFSAASHSSVPFNMPTVSDEEASEYLENRIAASTAGLAFGPKADVVDLAEDFIAHSQRMRTQSSASPAPTVGHVQVIRQAGVITSIEIDDHWARGRSARIIAKAVLAEANRAEDPRPEDDMLFSALSALFQLAERN